MWGVGAVISPQEMMVLSQFESKELEIFKGILKTISKRGVPEILFCLKRGEKKFSQIMFETRLNPGVLGRHLKELKSLNMVDKDGDYYFLTDVGIGAIEILEDLKRLAALIGN
ncbi:ArsR family transcriptional regulator [Geoglobus acetivorans]|uniref:ArsR family transcriptional regulator n=1 Tax=Geoglobus acetivorans TaxID=565033 RepID=A0ABZ3H3I8_GEOAI